MKLKVHVRTQPETQQGALHALELAVKPQDTVKSIKERISTIEPVPFPDQDLVLDGKVLEDDVRLAECALEDGSSLDLLVKASEDVLAQQLSDLLQARAISPEELGLLYAHRHGVAAGGALKVIGRKEQLRDFLKWHDSFQLENGLVSYIGKSSAGKPTQAAGALGKIPEEGPLCGDGQSEGYFPVHVSVVLQAPSAPDETSSVDLRARDTDTVLGLKERISAAELMPFPDRKLFLGGGELYDQQRLADCGVKDGSSLDFVATASEEAFAQQLVELLQAQATSINELSLSYSLRHGAAVSRVLKVLGRGERLPGFLERLPQFSVQGGCVRLAAEAPASEHQNQRYVDLHNEICSAAFRQKAAAALEHTAALVSHAGCLNVRRVVLSGSVGRGTAALGADDAEAVLFLEGLPPTGRERWLPGLLSATAATLQAQLSGTDGIEAVHAAADSVQVRCQGDFTVSLFISPAFESYAEVIDALGAHPCSAAALAEQRAHFISQQPESARMAMRLLKWWRSRQTWSTSRSRPSDWLLELAVAHAATQSGSSDLSKVIDGVWALLADFDRACIVWPRGAACYEDGEVPEALLRQQPLLLDPTNPRVNVADAQVFDAREIMALAKSPDF